MHLLRTKFKSGIAAEFLLPKKPSKKLIIFCDGLPSLPNKKKLMLYWSRQGYWVFHPRYRGTWESSGEFLANSPEKDILDVVDELKTNKKVLSVWDKVEHEINPEEINIVGGSFGGAAALLLSRDERINKVIAVAPVVDWTAPMEEEPLDEFGPFIKKAYGEAYRFTKENWDKLKTGEFYNPVNYINEMQAQKIMIIHAEDDTIVRINEVREFAKKVGCKFYPVEKGGHLSSSMLTKFPWCHRTKKFLRKSG